MEAHLSKPERIRNLSAFIPSYMQSNSGQRALTRQPTFQEVDNEFTKGRVDFRYNVMAHALNEAKVKRHA